MTKETKSDKTGRPRESGPERVEGMGAGAAPYNRSPFSPAYQRFQVWR